MAEVGDAIEEVRAEIATAASEFMPDVCRLISTALATQGDGHTISETVSATDIPCSHEQLSGGGVQIDDNGSVAIKTHRIQMPYTSETILINRHYKIRVTARGFNPQMIFEHPVRQIDAMSPLVTVYATLSEGYRRPGVT
jgi:hypothetical protein